MKTVRETCLWRMMRWMLIMALVIAMIPTMPGEAASKKSKALNAYKKKLSQSTVTVIPKGKRVITWDDKIVTYKSSKRANVKFALAYIDNDDVPELILQDTYYGYGVWVYTGGKVKCVHWGDSYDEPYGYYRKKGMYEDISHSEGTPFGKRFYKFKNNKMTFKLLKWVYCEGQPEAEYSIISSGKEKYVSKATFKKKLKSYVGNTKVTKITMRKNTSSNRKKYLK